MRRNSHRRKGYRDVPRHLEGQEVRERLPCSDVYDFELPPQLDDIVDMIVVVSDRYARLVRACAVTAPVLRLRAPIDLHWLTPRGRLRTRPRRAVLLGNYPERHDLVRRAWGDRGLELVTVGGDQQRYDVAGALADADIVVGKSRAVLDAMACGRQFTCTTCSEATAG